MSSPDIEKYQDKLEMKVEMTIIENLGLKMYVNLPPVISELVANCYDADAKIVEIQIPEGSITDNSEIIVKDYGCGMTFDQINDAYLRIGRNRRKEEKRELTPKFKRKVMGRKGIGKLSAFGVAKIVEIDTRREGLHTIFEMDIDKIKQTKSGKFYKPDVKFVEKVPETEKGTIVKLKRLKRKRAIDVKSVKTRLARRFTVIGPDFEVKINGKPILPEDRLLKEKCQWIWKVEDEKISEENDWTVSGWIGTMKSPLEDKDLAGVVIVVRGKLAQEPTYFEIKGAKQFIEVYLVGEIHAEFLDEEEEFISAYRGSIVWESEPGSVLKEWGQKKLRKIQGEWSERRRQEREKVIREDSEFKVWLEDLPPAEAKMADKFIKAITSDEKMEEERRKELAHFMIDSFEQRVFQTLIAALPEEPQDARLIEIFEEWGFIEAKEILRIVRGRISTIDQFVKFVKENAREKPTLHNFFREWPWILDPTWTQWNDEVRFSQLLRENFPDDDLDEPDRRIDFVCVGAGDTVHVVELKRPGHKINADDLEQLLHYVAFVRRRLDNVPERGYRDASGYIIGGEVSRDELTQEKKLALQGRRMYVRRYDNLIVIAQKLHDDFRTKLEKFERRRKERKVQTREENI